MSNQKRVTTYTINFNQPLPKFLLIRRCHRGDGVETSPPQISGMNRNFFMRFSLIGKHILTNFLSITIFEAACKKKTKNGGLQTNVNVILPDSSKVQQHVRTKGNTFRCETDRKNQKWPPLPAVYVCNSEYLSL